MAFYVPKSTIYIHSNTKRILEVKNPYHRDNEIIKCRNLRIWKLLDIKNIYQRGNEIIKLGIEATKYKNRNINETKIHKDREITKLVQGNRNQYGAKKLKKLTILNYTEQGKQQKFIITFRLYLYFIL